MLSRISLTMSYYALLKSLDFVLGVYKDTLSCSVVRKSQYFSHYLHYYNTLSPQPSRRVNQSGACSGSDVITSGPRKSETTMEDKLIVVVCGYPELYIDLRTFTKTGIHFATRLELPGRRPSHDANSRLLCIVSEFHARMARISRANEASKVKMFKRFIRDLFASFASGVNERTCRERGFSGNAGHKTEICSQTLLYQTLYARWNENDIHSFLKTVNVSFHQKYSDIKTPAQVSILKRAELNSRISVGGIYNLSCHK